MMNPLQAGQQAPPQLQQQQVGGPSGIGIGIGMPAAPVLAVPPPSDRELVSFSVKSAETFVSAYYAATDSPNRVRLLPILYSPTASIVWNGTPIPPASEDGDASAQQVAGTAPVNGGADGAGKTGGLAALLAAMPGSKHEVSNFDAHPVGWGIGADGMPALRSILIHVSGLVQHHTVAAALPPTNAPKSTVGSSGWISTEAMLALPRAFSQTFVLIDGAGAAGSEQGGVRVVEERNVRSGPSGGGGGGGGAGGNGAVPPAAPAQQQKVTRAARWFVQSDSFRFVG
ncbi:hypothetical protein OC834_006021 [Tilletia horrida]|nr:hypothetical protein OC834_006021 [Tilletia horrida]